MLKECSSERKNSVSDELDEVTISVSNPFGANDLRLNFTLFSKDPITRDSINVTTFNENENYLLEYFKDNIDQKPSESVTITDDDFQSKDTWLMKERDFYEILVQEDVHRDVIYDHDDQQNAGSIYGKQQLKTGEDAPQGVHEIVNLLKFWQHLKKVSENSTFVIVSVKEKLFIATFSADENLMNLKGKVVAMNEEIQIPDTCKLKNLATGRSINPDKFASTKCSGYSR